MIEQYFNWFNSLNSDYKVLACFSAFVMIFITVLLCEAFIVLYLRNKNIEKVVVKK